jgi:hypothetical protein
MLDVELYPCLLPLLSLTSVGGGGGKNAWQSSSLPPPSQDRTILKNHPIQLFLTNPMITW